jgi:hypothetical protein
MWVITLSKGPSELLQAGWAAPGCYERRLCRRKRRFSCLATAMSSSSCHSCCSQVLARGSSWLLAASELREDVERHHNANVDEAKQHHRGGPELPAGSVLCKECKLVSLVLRSSLLTRKPAGLVGGLGPSEGTLASSLLL